VRIITENKNEDYYVCPVCGYEKLSEKPYNTYGNPSYEICPCCGFEFGFDDQSRKITYEEYRNQWIEKGMKWFDSSEKPENWDYKKQLENIGIE
jgi:transcription elongation factor Elf1